MARPGLTRHRKFARLACLLGSKALALGHLEMMWTVAYENGDDLLGNAGDLECLAEWQGERGKLAASLLEAGFVEESEDGFRIHDLWDHAPDYVRKRRTREQERQEKGAKLRSVTGQCPPNGGQRPPNGRTPSPSPSPSPSREAKACGQPAADPPSAELVLAEVFPNAKTPPPPVRGPDLPTLTAPAGEQPRNPPPAEAPAGATSRTDQAREVFDHWNATLQGGRARSFDGKRKAAVEARLKAGYTSADLCKAVDGCGQTPHNMGQNDRGEPFCDLELICRDAQHVDRFMRNADHPPQAPPTGKGIKGFQDITPASKRFHEENAGKDIAL